MNMALMMKQPLEIYTYDATFVRAWKVWVMVLHTVTKVITIVFLMTLRLRLSLPYHLFWVIMMLRDILIGR
jgi:hypothetical protein